MALLGEYGNLLPRYTGPRCLVERQAVGGCDLCAQACPHAAITITDRVEIDPQLCTGCGLCVQSCPTGALEYDLLPVLNVVRSQGQQEGAITCSQSGAGGEALPCLGRVTAAAVVAAGGWDVPLTLLHGDCHTCAVGGPEVPQRLNEVVAEAQALRQATGRPARVTIRRAQAGELAGQGRVSRRGLFGALARQARQVVAHAIPESPLPFVDWSIPEERRPAEWLWRKQALRPTPPPQQGFWPAPVVLPGCIDCPVCANVCPTSAIIRQREETGRYSLYLDLQACTGCDACTRSCPPQVIELRPYPEEAFVGPVLLKGDGTEG